MRYIFPVIFFVLIISACGSNKKPDGQAYLDSLEQAEAKKDSGNNKPEVSEDVLESIIQQIPSPLEISVLLKESGTDFDKSFLNDPDNISNYNSNFEKAVNLGIYGTDLGYSNIYEQNQVAIHYLNSIKQLADELSIGQFFQFGTIKRLATNSRNLDSLLLITTKNFNNINEYLRDQERENLSVLLLTGGWLEALHIICQVAEKNPDSNELRDRIGEQKIIIENIVLLLSLYKDMNPNFEELHKHMKQLKEDFSKIEIKKSYKESTMKEVDGIVTIKNESKSEVIISDEDIKNITNTISSIRKDVI